MSDEGAVVREIRMLDITPHTRQWCVGMFGLHDPWVRVCVLGMPKDVWWTDDQLAARIAEMRADGRLPPEST